MVKRTLPSIFIILFSVFCLPGATMAALPSGVTLGEFRFFSEDYSKIAGSISEVDDYLIFTKVTPGSVFFSCFLLPGFNATTEVGYAYNIQVTDIGTGLLYKYKSTAKGTADDVLMWQENIKINPYTPGTALVSPTAPDSNSTNVTSEEPSTALNISGGTSIQDSGIDDTKCPDNPLIITNADGTTEKAYSKGILKGVSCERATKTLEEVLLIVRNIVTTLLLPIVGILFLIMMMIGGILYITSAGNQQRADRGKKILTAAIIGLLIVTLSYTLIAIFANIIGGGIG